MMHPIEQISDGEATHVYAKRGRVRVARGKNDRHAYLDHRSDLVAYPCLESHQIADAAEFGDACSFRKGEHLVRTGENPFNCFVLLSGSACVLDFTAGTRRVFTRYGAGYFTGDVHLFTGRRALITIEAETDIEAIRLTPQKLREIFTSRPLLGEILWKAFQRRRELLSSSHFRGLTVFGAREDSVTHELVEMLSRNMVPHEWLDVSMPENEARLVACGLRKGHCPAVVHGSEVLFERPTRVQVSEYLGLRRKVSGRHYDVAILGAGPSGLGAAVNAAAEGLSTLVLDTVGPGGQAGASSQIENYAGFPAGVSGRELANLTYMQALKFGAEFVSAATVQALERRPDGTYAVKTREGDSVSAGAVILAFGVSYRLLAVEGVSSHYGAGVYYSATMIEALRCKGGHVHIVGAGNSAGQAAMFLSQHVSRVTLIVRSSDLRNSMSDYLVRRLLANTKVDVLYRTQVTSVEADSYLRAVSVTHADGSQSRFASSGLFVFTGAEPRTASLSPQLATDAKGFVLSGAAVSKLPGWRETRCPLPLETSLPGVFAAGDCRSGSAKRVSSAIADGALAVASIHEHLARSRQPGSWLPPMAG